MDLFWETRRLTQLREDHLTCFLAAALEVDLGFRRAYGARVLAPLAEAGAAPDIKAVRSQVEFEEARSRPDLVIDLEDGRRIICEHKLGAPETLQISAEGESLKQLERYLELPGVDYLAYFRSSIAPPSPQVLGHPKYLRPSHAPHFLWRDLYPALERCDHQVTHWLRQGFERLGFTPPHPHIGDLWPDDTELVRRNQSNFGKLWDNTRAALQDSFRFEVGRRCELYFAPAWPSLISSAHATPLAQEGTLLRCRIVPKPGREAEARARLDRIAPMLPVAPDITENRSSSGEPCIDLLVSLRAVLGIGDDAGVFSERLKLQVAPLLSAMSRTSD